MNARTAIMPIIMALLPGCTIGNEPVTASLNTLVNTPSEYNGKVVQTFGLLGLHFEGNVVCEDLEATRNCLVVELPGSWQAQRAKYAELNGAWVSVSGMFIQNEIGHEGEGGSSQKLIIRLGNNLHKIQKGSVKKYARK